MSRRIFLRRFVAVALAAFGFISAGAEAQWHYTYFKEKVPLTLDVERVAVLQSDTTSERGPNGIAAGGIDAADVTPSPIPGWYLVGTADGKKTPGDVEQAVRDLAAQDVNDFVSPVFVDASGSPLIVTPHILVGFDRTIDAARAEEILRESKAGVVVDRDWANMKRAYRVKSTSRNGFDVLAAANRLTARPEVVFAEPDMIITGRHSLFPNDPGFGNCWGLHNTGQFGGIPDMDMDAPEAWDLTTGDPSIIVVIIDTGVQQDHPDINQMTGTDTTSDASTDGGPVNACDNHGTAVAGCVSATINNNLGTVGVAPDCLAASARSFISTLDCSGTWNAQWSWTVDTLAWAESVGAKVTNNSNIYSYGNPSAAITQKYEDTRNGGMVHFASAHNDGIAQISFPANLPTVNAVAALDPDGTLTSFSNWGDGLAFSAPGISVYTTDRTGSAGWTPGDYVFAQGTSFASPYTAGVAALMLSSDPTLTPDEVEQFMQQSAVDLGDPGYDTTYGWGFVNAEQAVLTAAPPVEPCELQKLLASDAAVSDFFGGSVSVSGDTVVVGARLDDCAVGSNCGAGYVFRFDGTSWVQTAKLTASDAVVGDQFGNSVSVSGDTVVVGAKTDDCAAGDHCGSAYVFEKPATGWVDMTETAKLTASDAAGSDFFG
ncbi:MAG: S8 family serine peptidase, partial [Planctomycetes bacterium]|nr:S8 family serine peptidase [Planctomycetota bacterium]